MNVILFGNLSKKGWGAGLMSGDTSKGIPYLFLVVRGVFIKMGLYAEGRGL